jgi:hypothetical protein
MIAALSSIATHVLVYTPSIHPTCVVSLQHCSVSGLQRRLCIAIIAALPSTATHVLLWNAPITVFLLLQHCSVSSVQWRLCTARFQLCHQLQHMCSLNCIHPPLLRCVVTALQRQWSAAQAVHRPDCCSIVHCNTCAPVRRTHSPHLCSVVCSYTAASVACSGGCAAP